MRLAWAILAFVSFCVNATYPGQAVFDTSERPISSQWSFTTEPSINATSHLIFTTVSSFLQHWPNTRYRNGHNIVPATVPVGTLLYHGTFKEEIPKVPEWTATDPEHSYLFCRSVESDSGCWHLTLVATRPLKVLYFDGSSAAKMRDGPMDSQDLVVWGEVKPDWAMRERERIADLCDWGKQYGIDGFLRMEMDFEIMLCDFSAGVKPVSFLNLVSASRGSRKRAPTPGSPPSDPPLSPSRIFKWSNNMQMAEPEDPDRPKLYPSQISALFRVIEAGSWHNRFPGDPRIQIDYPRLISFYDTVMFPSLQSARLGKGRLNHRLEGISPADAKTFTARLAEVLKDGLGNPGSGIDWQNLIRVIINRYAERIELLHYILSSTSITSEADAESTLKQAHRHITSMIVPYILHSAVPLNSVVPSGNYSWAAPVFELCATTHTNYVETDELSGKLTPSERVLLNSVRGTTKEICRMLVGFWAEGVESGLEKPDIQAPYTASAISLQELVREWKSRVERLMTWLDWSYWLRCRPACSYEEMCYLPTWPFFARPQLRMPPKSLFLRDWIWRPREGDGEFNRDEDEGEWLDPQPRCIRRVEPLVFKDDFVGLTQVE